MREIPAGAGFSISLECESGAVSSTSNSTSSSANVAMGFMVNQANAVSKAQSLGLVTSGGGLTWLLDTNYGSGAGEASGVGIQILNNGGSALNLLPAKSSFGSGNSYGWYGFKDLLSLTGAGSGTDIYTGDFTAELSAITGQTVTAGSVMRSYRLLSAFSKKIIKAKWLCCVLFVLAQPGFAVVNVESYPGNI